MLRHYAKQNWFKLVIYSITSALLLSCALQQTPPSLDTGDGGLLSPDSTCRPPCFWGISPGKTTKVEVDEILQSKDIFSICDAFDTQAQGGSKGITCGSGLLVTYQQGTGVVDGIGIIPSRLLTVGDAIGNYGDPSAVLVTLQGTPEEKQRTSMMLYFDNMFTTLVLPEQQGYSFDLRATTLIKSLGYYDPTSYQSTRQYSSVWVGYGIYEPLQR